MSAEVTCQELVELITDYLEDALSPAERARVRRHLDRCGPCNVYLEQMREVIRVTGMLRTDDVPPAALDHLLPLLHALPRREGRGASADWHVRQG